MRPPLLCMEFVHSAVTDVHKLKTVMYVISASGTELSTATIKDSFERTAEVRNVYLHRGVLSNGVQVTGIKGASGFPYPLWYLHCPMHLSATSFSRSHERLRRHLQLLRIGQSPFRWYRPPQCPQVRHACYWWRQAGLLTCPLSLPDHIKRPLVNIEYIYHELYRADVRVRHLAKHLNRLWAMTSWRHRIYASLRVPKYRSIAFSNYWVWRTDQKKQYR